MADELSWDEARIAAEFDHSRKLLLSFGLEPALAELSIDDIRAGKSVGFDRYERDGDRAVADESKRGRDISLQSNDTARSGGGT